MLRGVDAGREPTNRRFPQDDDVPLFLCNISNPEASNTFWILRVLQIVSHLFQNVFEITNLL